VLNRYKGSTTLLGRAVAAVSSKPLENVGEIRREARAQLRAVEALLRKWDPIGVIPDLAEAGGPLDEYDSYAPYIVGILHRGASVTEVATHLSYCRTGAMGLPANHQADLAAASEIYEWWQSTQPLNRFTDRSINGSA